MALWSMIASVVAALGTLGALGAAIYAGVWAGRVAKVEFDRDARAESDRRDRDTEAQRAQASKISAWLAQEDERHETVWHIEIGNSSDEPVYDVDLFIYMHAPGAKSHEDPVYYHFHKNARVVPPGGTKLKTTSDEGLRLADSRTRLVALAFRDATNRNWTRNEWGVLTIAEEPCDVKAFIKAEDDRHRREHLKLG